MNTFPPILSEAELVLSEGALRVRRLSEQKLAVWDVLAAIDPKESILFLGGPSSRLSYLALAWDEVASAEVLVRQPEPPRGAESLGLKFSLGTLFLHSYDAWDERNAAQGARLRAFEIRRALVWDHSAGYVYLCEEDAWEACSTKLSGLLDKPLQQSLTSVTPSWTSTLDNAGYCDKVRRVIEDIKEGRYYQLNFLRYWRSSAPISREHWLKRMKAVSGPYGAWLDLPDLGVISFSPERFVSLTWEGAAAYLQTEPIKGTRAVVQDPHENAKALADLATHPKDAAELNMIIDLMRNDLQRVSEPRSVQVVDPGSVQSFQQVHHRIATIRSRLRSSVDWGEIWKALCPGGSITGAPKKEVQKAILELEGRARGYLMGHIFFLDRYTGLVDSSILIRTAQRCADHTWEYAAGSGLTIQSQVEEERAEVLAKARVILDES